MSKLLIDERPLMVLPKFAEVVGLNEAIFVQQLHYWISGNAGKERDGKRWVYNTYEDWEEQFSFWSVSTIRRTIASCERKKLIMIGNYNKLGFDKTRWYTVNYKEVNRVSRRCVQSEQTSSPEWTDGVVQNEQTNTIEYPKTTSDTNGPAKAERIPYKEIIGYLNEQAGRKFNHKAQGNQDLIKARWNEGYNLGDFKKAIDNKVAHAKDPKHFFGEEYLRPSTLFRKSNFDEYVNAIVSKKEKKADNEMDFEELQKMLNGG